MLNKEVMRVLQQINNITNKVILRYPTTIAISESQDTLVSFDVSGLDSDEFPELAISDLSELLALLRLFNEEDREVSIEGVNIMISDKKANASYIIDKVALMQAQDKDSSQFTRTESMPTIATFKLTVDDIKAVGDASKVFKDLTEVLYTSQDGDISISLAATNKFNAKSNTFSINKDAETTKEFQIKIPVENFKLLPQTEYSVEIKYNSDKNAYRIMMYSEDLEDFKIMMTVKL